MNKQFPLFIRANTEKNSLEKNADFFDLDAIKSKIEKFRTQTEGKGLLDTLKELPDFVYKELTDDGYSQPGPKPEIPEKYKTIIKKKLDMMSPSGKPATVTKVHTVPSSFAETRQFYTQILSRLGAPVTPENLKFFDAWHFAEAGAFGGGASFNPFNTTMRADGPTTNFNSVGVKNYTSKEEGIDATVRTLRLGYYTELVASLRKGDSAMRSAEALSRSLWGTGNLAVRVLNRDSFTPSTIAFLPKDDGIALV